MRRFSTNVRMSAFVPPKFQPTAIIDGSRLNDSLVRGKYDTLVFVSPSLSIMELTFPDYAKLFTTYEQNVADFYAPGKCTMIASEASVPKKIIFAATGPATRDYDDVRIYRYATIKAFQSAAASGSKIIAVACCQYERFREAFFVTVSSALDIDYLPSDVRTLERSNRFTTVGIVCHTPEEQSVVNRVTRLNNGKTVMKDIGGGEPEQATPNGVRDYVQQLFLGSNIKVKVFTHEELLEEFPLLAAVDRASEGLDRHRGCVIELEYIPGKNPITETIFVIGKGITYDTGGVDLKVGGAMRYMSVDKCGAAVVAGFLKVVNDAKPSNLHVIGLMAMARNDIGPAAYVSDELIRSRSGLRICVGNTDAEGRMAMADVLCYAREKALNATNPTLFTIATLTGHVGIVYGNSYSAVLQNGPATISKIGDSLHQCGFALADPIEISQIRKEDYNFVLYPGDRADILQCNTLPSSRTPRGHNFPAAFLIFLSGLHKHGSDSQIVPLPYCHIDIASAVGPIDGTDHPQAASLTALSRRYNLC